VGRDDFNGQVYVMLQGKKRWLHFGGHYAHSEEELYDEAQTMIDHNLDKIDRDETTYLRLRRIIRIIVISSTAIAIWELVKFIYWCYRW